MIERLKRSLVDSFVGAIALGWLFAQSIVHFVDIFSAPVSGWIIRSEFPQFTNSVLAPTGFLFREALPDLIRSFSLLLAGYILLRWLYFEPLKNEPPEPMPNPEQPP